MVQINSPRKRHSVSSDLFYTKGRRVKMHKANRVFAEKRAKRVEGLQEKKCKKIASRFKVLSEKLDRYIDRCYDRKIPLSVTEQKELSSELKVWCSWARNVFNGEAFFAEFGKTSEFYVRSANRKHRFPLVNALYSASILLENRGLVDKGFSLSWYTGAIL